MFNQMLLGIFLVSSLVLLVLLVAPRPGQDLQAKRVTWIGLAVGSLAVVLAFTTGFMVGA